MPKSAKQVRERGRVWTSHQYVGNKRNRAWCSVGPWRRASGARAEPLNALFGIEGLRRLYVVWQTQEHANALRGAMCSH
eukprot:11166481-Lingulodinium_polyedra.AAC.1